MSTDLLDPSLFQEIKRIQLKSKRSISNDFVGNYRSAFRGSGLTFSDLREYQPGDDIRHIHWKVTARTGRPYIKSFEEERQLRIVLAIDISKSTAIGFPKSKHRRILEFAAFITVLTNASHDSLGLALFSAGIEEYLPLKKSRSHSKMILAKLATSKPHSDTTDLRKTLTELAYNIKQRSIIFLISDFYSANFQDALSNLSIRNDVIGVLLQDKLDSELPISGLVEFYDSESGANILIDCSAKHVRQNLINHQNERIKRLKHSFLKAGADLIVVKDDFIQPLRELMQARIMRE